MSKMWSAQLLWFLFWYSVQLRKQSNKFDPLVKDMNKASSAPSTNKTKFLNGLKFVSLNINGIRGKKLELLAFLDYHKPDIVAIQETKIDGSISTSELFHDSCPYNAYT